MGRIKQTYLKRVAEKLMKNYEGVLTTSFEENKVTVSAHTRIDGKSKSIRNKIAGYITSAMRQKQKAAM